MTRTMATSEQRLAPLWPSLSQFRFPPSSRRLFRLSCCRLLFEIELKPETRLKRKCETSNNSSQRRSEALFWPLSRSRLSSPQLCSSLCCRGNSSLHSRRTPRQDIPSGCSIDRLPPSCATRPEASQAGQVQTASKQLLVFALVLAACN